MSHPTVLAEPTYDRRPRMLAVAVLVVIFMAAMTATASATLGIQTFNNPAGDPTVQTYTLLRDGQPVTPLPKGNPFTLMPGEDQNYGPPTGTYVWKATPAQGWKVAAISCVHYVMNGSELVPVAPRAGEFTYDLANGQVTIDHRVIDDGNPNNDDDQVCAFTNSKVSASGGSGVSPTLPGGGGSTIRGPSLLRVTAGKFFASAKISIGRQSVIRASLLYRNRVVGTARVEHKAGTYTVKVNLKKKYRERWRRQGRKRITLALKVTVVGNNRATKVFQSGVIVRLR
jgi:hypothetical protein